MCRRAPHFRTTCVESDAHLPAITEDDKHARPALPDEQRQCGRAKSKLESGEDSLFLPEVVDAACTNFAKFWQLPRSSINDDVIMYRLPPAGFAGWSYSDLVVRDYDEIREREKREHGMGDWLSQVLL